jgi:hypothetical protein
MQELLSEIRNLMDKLMTYDLTSEERLMIYCRILWTLAFCREFKDPLPYALDQLQFIGAAAIDLHQNKHE